MDSYFLFWTLFFPRLTLLYCYAMGVMPANAMPFWGDVVMSVFVPRVLVLIYIFTNLGAESGWFWAHVVAMILVYGSSASSSSDSKK